MVRAVIFDCFGVLVQSGTKLVYKAFPHLLTEINDLEHQVDYGLISQQEYYDQIAKLTGLSADEVFNKYYAREVRDETVFDWARQLKATGKYMIGLISNVGSNRLQDFLSKDEQVNLFDQIIASADVGLAKPEMAIFELMASRLGLEPNECVMIDDISINIEGSIDAGMKGIMFTSTEFVKVEFNKLIEPNNA